jgi:predicted DNA-binding transcriptional regulator AlpA
MLQLSPRTIQRHVARQIIPPPLRIGHSVRWREADIDAYLAGQQPAVIHTGGSETIQEGR